VGLIVDTTIFVAGERRGQTIRQIAEDIKRVHGNARSAVSAVTMVEMTHGIYRARTQAQKDSRRLFTDELYREFFVHPLSLEIAKLAGRIEGEQAAIGNSIAFPDLVIGATALYLGSYQPSTSAISR